MTQIKKRATWTGLDGKEGVSAVVHQAVKHLQELW